MKLGMVFEGGANRTVFSCGVMDAFLKERLMPDYLIGVSARDCIRCILPVGTEGQEYRGCGKLYRGQAVYGHAASF